MASYFSYSLSGSGVTPDKLFSFVNLLKEAGVIFSARPKCGHIGGKLLFFPTQPISRETEKVILERLAKKGVKKARLESWGKYSKQ